MKSFTTLQSIAALLDYTNIDTDQIISKQFMKSTERTGYGKHLFANWRYLDNQELNPDFPLNKPSFQGAQILVANENFGCGSSREHAPWALVDYGFRCIIAPSFADIFYNNCFNNGILPIRVSIDEKKQLADQITQQEGISFTIDLPAQTIVTEKGLTIPFSIDANKKEMLLKGLDEIGLTLHNVEAISAFEQTQKQNNQWLWQ